MYSVPHCLLFQESQNMSALDKAKLDCLSAFALNSLVWMWLRTKGENPKESEVTCLYQILQLVVWVWVFF